MRLGALLLLVLVLLPMLAQAQVPATPLDPILAPQTARTLSTAQGATGTDLFREEVDIHMRMEFRTVDFDTINVVFGGGTFQAQARLATRFEFYVISASRIQEALEKVAPGQANLSRYGVDASRNYIAADEFRATFAGPALQAFEDEQEERATEFITSTLPNVTVLSAQFVWSNAEPTEGWEGDLLTPPSDPREANDLRLPPIVLDTVFELQYVERTSLLTIAEDYWQTRKDERTAERKEQVADAAADYERGAFGVMGITQVVDLKMPPGWNLALSVALPQGYTFEEASPDVDLAADRRAAAASTFARHADGFVANPVALTFSNRFVVSTAMLAVVLICGAGLRFPITLLWNLVRRRRSAARAP